MAVIIAHVAGSAWAGLWLMAGLAVVFGIGWRMEKRVK